jgi:hypothetical protein
MSSSRSRRSSVYPCVVATLAWRINFDVDNRSHPEASNTVVAK